MLLDIDSRRPLKFARKAESPERDEVTIEIKYEMLFKHFSTCGMLTHEKEYCPLLQHQGVFARVQLQENRPQQYSKVLVKKEPNALHSNAPVAPYHKPSSYATERNNNGRRNYDLDHPLEAYKGRVDRMIRRRDDQSWRKRYGGARVEAKPYDRYNGASWREKKSQPQSHHDENVVHDRLVRASMDRGDGSYDHQMRSVSPLPRESAKRVQADREASPQQSQPRPSPDQRSLESGNKKYKISVRNNAGKTTPDAIAPMANAYANTIVLKKKKSKKPSPRLFATGSAMKRARDFSF
ncbi:hypothetical protein YC2023_059630 [Brassica napus]